MRTDRMKARKRMKIRRIKAAVKLILSALGESFAAAIGMIFFLFLFFYLSMSLSE